MAAGAASYDYIVVGGGSAGCAAAYRLVQDYKAKVLLLEGGGRDTNPLIKIPAGSFKLVFTDKKAINNIQSEPQRQLGGRVVNVAQGTVLGGGSSVNAMFYVRGTPADYDRWGELTDNEYGWNWEGMLA